MSIIDRIRAILLRPRETWQVIAAEATDARRLYVEYLVFLAAIPAVAGFVGHSLVGFGKVLGVTVRVPIISGLLQMAVGFAMNLLGVYLLSLIINAFAPRYGGQTDALAALKVAVYAATASLIGGLFSVVPALSALGVIAGLYSIYLLYLGLPILMKSSPKKTGVYTAVVIACAIVTALIIGAASTLILPDAMTPGSVSQAGSHAAHDPELRNGRTTASNALEELARRAATAAESGDTKDLASVFASAMTTTMAAVTDNGTRSASTRDASGPDDASFSESDAADNPPPTTGNNDDQQSDAIIPPIPDAPEMPSASGAERSVYGIGKAKLPAPPARAQCVTESEHEAAALGSGCDCSCEAYAQGPSAQCQTACALAYYGCWAPDVSDTELAAAIDDPALRAQIQSLDPSARSEMLGYQRAAVMLNRAVAWEQAQRCASP